MRDQTKRKTNERIQLNGNAKKKEEIRFNLSMLCPC